MTFSAPISGLHLFLLWLVCSGIPDQCYGVFSEPAVPSASGTQEPAAVGKMCDKFSEKCDPKTEHCPSVEDCTKTFPTSRQMCYAVWRNGSEGIQIVMKGCWTEDSCYGQRQCIQRDPTGSVSRGHYFCCCEGDFCNRNITHQSAASATEIKQETTSYPPPVRKGNGSQLKQTLLFSIVPIIGVAVIIVSVFALWKYHRRNLYTGHQQLPTVEPFYVSTPSEHSLNLEKVELLVLRARGRFGQVWKAQLHNEFVAVKIFPLQDKQSWQTEQEMYNLPQMNHENVLRFIASEKRGENLNVELWLLTEFHENGSLYDYLKAHVLSWADLCKIGETMARGLAFLHDELPATSLHAAKPAVAHRDFKSKNVLLKADLSACISDFGLAIKFEQGKGPGETHGLVGTRRYMAPEVLEGAICFNRDSFLRIDMYACGLVLWELLSRCNAAEGPVEEYKLPFEAAPEVGPHPTLEAMQNYVVTRKMRPAIREHWKRHPGMASLVATAEECWDQDAEARLSAGCVQERIASLSHTSNMTSISMLPPPLTVTMPPPLGVSPPRSNDSALSFSTSSDIPPKDLSSC